MSRLPHLSNRFNQQTENAYTNQPASQSQYNNLHYNNDPLRNNLQNQPNYPHPPENENSKIPKKQEENQNSYPLTHTNTISQPQPNSPSLSSQIGRKKQVHKIDPSQIPRPFNTSESSYKPIKLLTSNRSNPLPQANQFFSITEEGNAGPRHIRATCYTIPNETSSWNVSQIPFGLIVQPLADVSQDEDDVPLIYPNNGLPFRCSRCKAYINPFFNWIDNGNSTVCNLCKMTNSVNSDYYSSLDENGRRKDKYTRPELYKGVYEIVAPKEYYNKPICENHLMICLELSVQNVINGVFTQAVSSLQSLLEHIPCQERTNVCIMTFDQNLYFYNIPQDLTKELQILVVTDMEESCVPLPVNKLFLNLATQRDKLDYLLEKISKFAEVLASNSKSNGMNKQAYTSGSLGYLLLNAVQCFNPHTGRVIVFTSQMPVNGYGKLKRRDDYKLSGTEKEKTLYVPQTDAYEKLAKQYLDNRISVDLFVINNEYFDLATIYPICAMTGGSLYYYPRYNGIYDGERLHYDLARNLTRYYAYDVIMTVRTSPGIILLEYYNGMGKMPVRDLEFSTMDSDKTVAISLKQEEKITDSEAYIQYAILYTNPFGQRVIRVINLSFQVSNNIQNIFRYSDVDAVFQLLTKKFIRNNMLLPIKAIRDTLTSHIINILYSYRSYCAVSSSSGQLILPEGMKILPMYLNSAFKNDILKIGNDVSPDDRIYACYRFLTAPIYDIAGLLYPRCFEIHKIFENENELTPGNYYEEKSVILPSSIPLTVEKFENHGIYMIDNIDTIYLYVLKDVNPILIKSLFGVETFNEIIDVIQLPYFEENNFSVRIACIIEQLRKNKNSSYQNVRIVTEKDPALDQYLLNLLIEDEVRGNEHYSDFLCKLHLQIQQKFN